MRILAAFTGNEEVLRFADWAASPTGMFVIGALLIVVLTGLFILGLRVYFRVQNVLFVLAMLATVLVVFVALVRSPAVLQSNLAQYLGNLAGRPDILEALLRESGYQPQPFDLRNTIITMTWIYLTMGFSFSSAYIGGEVKQASKIQVWAIPGTVVYALVWGLLLV